MAHESIQGESWAVLFTTLAAATICFGLRLLRRSVTKVKLWWDDYFAMIGYVCCILWIALIATWIHYGLGLHIKEIEGYTLDQLLYINKLILWIAEILYAFSLYLSKTSILCFYLRLFGQSNIRRPIQILLGCAVIWIVIRTFLAIFHCIPVQAYWDASVQGHCAIEDIKFFYGSITVHVVMDCVIIALPIIPIRHLNLPLKQRIAVAVVFMFGIFVAIGGVMIMVEASKFDTTSVDLTWNIQPIMTWATVEVNMVVVSASLPTIRPAVLWILRIQSRHSGDSSNQHGSYNTNATSRSHMSKGIKLSSMGSTNGSPKRGITDIGDEAGSTCQLAHGGRDNSSGEFDASQLDRTDFRTVIGHGSIGGGSRNNKKGAAQNGDGQIVVKSETSVRVDPRRKH